MNLEIWFVFFMTVLAFMVTPGPSHLLMLSNSMTHGFRPSLATAAGDLTANAFQMLAAGLGLAALLIASQGALTVIKWAGVCYLVWMGVRMWRNAGSASSTAGTAPNAALKTLWLQGFITSAANPKAVVFFAALFPQFIDPSQPFLSQFFILSVTYIAIDGAFLASYGAGAGWLAARLKGRATKLVNRVGATFLIGAALLLGFKTLREAR
ncbi:LysE family translocator [Hoeflea prorocentri]|uniref:LysE family transporter n=1 Tax=Hoeflea prorocentri TaxID=1922333 RepID=A0A9X3UKT3_9HYPH|nr:LysE family transporter [Hoeflea prorocentri]MCY6382643.1 LysE family transporter [Hoeflea prorocentri]MDA5400443.1 LysE family transporter [Hoeflea prorocentri]